MAISHIIENHGDTFHWQIVFYIAASVYTVGNLLYCIMASGEEQSWNKIRDENYYAHHVSKQNFVSNVTFTSFSPVTKISTPWVVSNIVIK